MLVATKKNSNIFTESQKKGLWDQYNILRQPIFEEREHQEKCRNDRSSFQRDYARILYSSSFRKLQGKMQVLGVKSSAFYRNRLTHSLEVGQIATSIATILSRECELVMQKPFSELQYGHLAMGIRQTTKRMYEDDLKVIEAAALAHDIGHPAFGHKGERVLNELVEPFNMRFEGNAQNFRILRTLEKKNDDSEGLNLTYRTLLAINKYVNKATAEKSNKKFMYEEDYEALKTKIRENRKAKKRIGLKRTLDVQIIELADDIAYSVHDLEDGLKLRKFNIDDLLFQLRKNISDDRGEVSSFKHFQRIVTDLRENYDLENIPDIETRYKLFTTNLTSRLTDWFVNSLDYGPVTVLGRTANELTLKAGVMKFLKTLKDTVFEANIRDNEIQRYEITGEIVLKSLFLAYTHPDNNKDGKLLPTNFRPRLNKLIAQAGKEVQEAVYWLEIVKNSIDYMAGMMDAYAVEEYERLFHKDFNDISINELDEVNWLVKERSEELNQKFKILHLYRKQFPKGNDEENDSTEDGR